MMPAVPHLPASDRLAALGAVIAATALVTLASFVVFSRVQPADIRALWLAGQAFAEGRLDQIYPADRDFFTMIPPAGWVELAARQGYHGQIYPFLYPPLWAALAAPLVKTVPTATLDLVVRLFDPLLLSALVVIAHRLTRTRLTAALAVPAALVLLAALPAGHVALGQGQPQLLVAILILWALEREEAGHSRTAGALMALAAALKVYPAILALLWLAGRRWRALAAFLLCGAALASASVLLAGWPLHAEFLRLLGVLAKTTMVSQMTYTIDGMLAQLSGTEALFRVDGTSVATAADQPAWLVGERSPALRLAGLAGTGLALLLGARALRRAQGPGARASVWAGVMILIALFGPISWGYHYLAPLAVFLMRAFDRPPLRALAAAAGVGTLMMHPLWKGSGLGGLITPESFMGTLGVALAAFLCLAWSRPRT